MCVSNLASGVLILIEFPVHIIVINIRINMAINVNTTKAMDILNT